METYKDSKRKKNKYDDGDEYRKERKRARTRSRSPAEVRENIRNGREKDSRRKRRHSKSRSPDTTKKQEKRDESDVNKKDLPTRKTKETDMLNTRTGGAYIPPARLRMMQAQITDKSSVAYQRLAWEALKKSIHGHINKINVGNIGIIIKELLKENIVRGRGLLCRSVIQAQAASPTFTNVYAALVAAVNSRFPNIGELLLKRLVIQFKRGFKRNDKPTCISSASFIAHLVNQRVAHEILALELLTLLVETPTDDSVEVAIAFLKECGQKLTEVSSKGVNAIFEMLRNILHEGQLDKRVQYMIEVMFQVWKDGFKDHPALIEELELVPEEEQFTHLLMLDDATDPQDILNVFKFDEKYEENEQKYKTLSKEILGSDAESDDEEGSGESGSEESDEEEEEEEKKEMTIIDNTETNLVALRRTIYLTINSSLDFEECAHKLMKMQLKPGQEIELCHMFLDCCAEQRTYEKFYGLLAQRFCNINRIYIGPFEQIFKDSYSTAHRLDTNRLRNVSKFFAHLLFTDSISWEVLECVKLNEEDTTSSSRIYIKILFQELAEYMGLKKLNERLKDPTLQEAFLGVFPRDNPKNTRFSINFFTSIGLGGLTDELREHLKQMPKNVPAPINEIKLDSESSSDSSSSSSDSSSSDSSSSDSSEEENKNDKSKKSKPKKKPSSPRVSDASNDENNKDTPVEKWGHDGFYETYGQDVRRTETRTNKADYNKVHDSVSRENHREDRREQNIENENRRNHSENSNDRTNQDRRRDNRTEQNSKDKYRRSYKEDEDMINHNNRDRRRNDRRDQYNQDNHRKNHRENENVRERNNLERRRDDRRENIDDRRNHREGQNINDQINRDRRKGSRREQNNDDDYRRNHEVRDDTRREIHVEDIRRAREETRQRYSNENEYKGEDQKDRKRQANNEHRKSDKYVEKPNDKNEYKRRDRDEKEDKRKRDRDSNDRTHREHNEGKSNRNLEEEPYKDYALNRNKDKSNEERNNRENIHKSKDDHHSKKLERKNKKHESSSSSEDESDKERKRKKKNSKENKGESDDRKLTTKETKKNKKKQSNETKDSSTSSSSSTSSESEDDNKKLGGRYWNQFDSASRTPEYPANI